MNNKNKCQIQCYAESTQRFIKKKDKKEKCHKNRKVGEQQKLLRVTGSLHDAVSHLFVGFVLICFSAPEHVQIQCCWKWRHQLPQKSPGSVQAVHMDLNT